jgi:hypothetical protein
MSIEVRICCWRKALTLPKWFTLGEACSGENSVSFDTLPTSARCLQMCCRSNERIRTFQTTLSFCLFQIWFRRGILSHHPNASHSTMNVRCHIVFVSFLLLSFSYAAEQTSFYSTLFGADDEAKADLREDDGWQPNNDDYIDEFKYHRASYQHEQALLASIYEPSRTYVSMHDDRIQPSNFTYFTFNNLGTYRFILISLRGDADLYISTRDKHVTYENYEFSSCTCGIDQILIDPYVKRPIYIGIYGSSQYQVSHYRFLVELVDATIPIDETTEDSSAQGQQTPRTNDKTPRVTGESREEKQHLLWDIFVWLLNILVEVLT